MPTKSGRIIVLRTPGFPLTQGLTGPLSYYLGAEPKTRQFYAKTTIHRPLKTSQMQRKNTHTLSKSSPSANSGRKLLNSFPPARLGAAKKPSRSQNYSTSKPICTHMAAGPLARRLVVLNAGASESARILDHRRCFRVCQESSDHHSRRSASTTAGRAPASSPTNLAPRASSSPSSSPALCTGSTTSMSS